jgi:hypothetical protein
VQANAFFIHGASLPLSKFALPIRARKNLTPDLYRYFIGALKMCEWYQDAIEEVLLGNIVPFA